MDGRAWTQSFEGLTLVAKPDAKGMWVIGRGHDIPPSPGRTCTIQDADTWFDIDYGELAIAAARRDVPNFDMLDPIRQAALVDMAFEDGQAGLAGFREMIAAIGKLDWTSTSAECLASLYAQQVPGRAHANARILLTGEWPE